MQGLRHWKANFWGFILGGGRPLTWWLTFFSLLNWPAMILSKGTLQLYSCFPQKISQSGGYFVGENLGPFSPTLSFHTPSPFGPYNQLQALVLGVRKIGLQAWYTKSPSISLISLKNLQVLHHHFFNTTNPHPSILHSRSLKVFSKA